MKILKLSSLLLPSILITGMSVNVNADSCASLIDDLVAWMKAPCDRCVNVLFYQMTVMNNDVFVGYSNGKLNYDGSNLYTNAANTLFSDRLWAGDCKPGTGMICLNSQPFDYHRPETFAFKIKKPGTLSLDFTPWNEHYTINLSCQNGYIYGLESGRLMVTLHAKKSKQAKIY